HHLDTPVNDIGLYVNSSKKLTDDLRYNLLINAYKPPENYDFKKDSSGPRCFRWVWISQYSPWLSYSPHLKGAICKYCTVFPQPVHRGTQGAFITMPFTRYKDFHEGARNHILTSWHKNAQMDAAHFLEIRKNPETSIVCQIDSSVKRQVEENRRKLFPILSTILFCGNHDIALRGKKSTTGNVQSLYQFRIEAGDMVLKNHLENAPVNARYTSVRVENELIALSEEILREDIVSLVNESNGFSVIADESADISGKEQLSIGVRFVDTSSTTAVIKEEFLGFATLKEMDATSVANMILNTCSKFGLNLEKLYGQGYDGCSTMAGKEGGVQAIIKRKYPKAAFAHCASHKLNLVVNDLNAVTDNRNCTGTIKAIIRFFRESPKRRALIPNVPLLSETRWTAKYKSIRIFSSNFEEIFQQLSLLVTTASGKTRQDAYQLQSSSSTTSFLFCLNIIANYSSRLESVSQALQAVQLDILKVCDHVQDLLTIFRGHRERAEEQFKEIFTKVQTMAEKLNIELSVPRQLEEYYRQSIYVPYLDSLIASLESRFGNENKKNFSLFSLYPKHLVKMSLEQYKCQITNISEIYSIENLEAEAMTWYEIWSPKDEQFDNGFLDLLNHTDLFPSVRQAILIALTLPVTTCTVERSFSTMRRVKTWLRSTMAVERLSGLCMMSIHRVEIEENKQQLIGKVINKFAQDPRRLQFLFGD
uniref:52 kDa repressor of the inhibitor of the protein kinase-like n=1 Tax=Leptobrachium leishanense TaxID=445787 RepID=A0A8C5R7M8_9ANUR